MSAAEVALDDGTRRRTREELADRTARFAHLLRDGLGLAPGMHAALLIGNRGDLGSVDEEGFVHLADRKSNMIISGGVNIYPAEIEAVLQEHPAVADVAVFGIPDDEWGEQVKAAVELMPACEASPELADELIAFTRVRLAAYKAPRSVDFEATLPRTPAGKLYVRRLRDPYWAGRERRI